VARIDAGAEGVTKRCHDKGETKEPLDEKPVKQSIKKKKRNSLTMIQGNCEPMTDMYIDVYIPVLAHELAWAENPVHNGGYVV